MRTTFGEWLGSIYSDFAGFVDKQRRLVFSLDEGHKKKLKWVLTHDVPNAAHQQRSLLLSALACREQEIMEAAGLALGKLVNMAVKRTSNDQLRKDAKGSMLKQKWLLLAFWCRGVDEIKSLLREGYGFVADGYRQQLQAYCDAVKNGEDV